MPKTFDEQFDAALEDVLNEMFGTKDRVKRIDNKIGKLQHRLGYQTSAANAAVKAKTRVRRASPANDHFDVTGHMHNKAAKATSKKLATQEKLGKLISKHQKLRKKMA